ncbi:hypothetical protein J1N35_026569 [Gossypium stocksii]|uniref:Reverse transcriptase domain-containing protein n=1 Tax=Gossypium stocksii TaxID=47602 RepID=A0A9D3VA07_9ROSI|nr:hypothetical protein J1N35_026569 [Gossypium stocksii]
MAIKLDLEKAYDRISWEFIDASLVAAGIPDFLIKVIMDAISSSSMQVLWNGVPSRSEISAGRWHLIQLSRSGPSLSHLFFADDLVIFGKAEMDQAIVLKDILQRFCDYSGHKISTRKRNMFFAKGVDSSVCDQISQLFGF